MFDIPMLKSSHLSIAPDPCGIHSIEINPSRTYLATGAHNTNDLAVYKLPTFDPICVGEVSAIDFYFFININTLFIIVFSYNFVK